MALKGKGQEGSKSKKKAAEGREGSTSKDLEKEAAKAKDVAKAPRVEEGAKAKDAVKTPRVEKEAGKPGKVAPRKQGLKDAGPAESGPEDDEEEEGSKAKAPKAAKAKETAKTPRIEEGAKAKDAVKTPRVKKEVGKLGKVAPRKQASKDAGPADLGSEGDKKAAKGKVPAPRVLIHRDGGRMEPTRKRPTAQAAQAKAKGKKVKSRSDVGTTDEEGEVRARGNGKLVGVVLTKPQRKPRVDESDAEVPEEEKVPARRIRLPKVVRDDSESEAAPKTKGKQKAVGEDTRQRQRKEESEEEEEEEVSPLERARQRAESKAPAPPPADCIEVEDKCARCTKMKTTCLWTPEAIKKAGPKACWRCKMKKVGCINSYRSSGPVPIDLGTPLEDLVDHLSPPVSNAAGVPRSGTAGEAENPTTLGELLVEVLANTRAVKEENMELKGQMKALRQAFDSMVAHNAQSHRQVLDAIKDIPPAPAPAPVPIARTWEPITFPIPSSPIALPKPTSPITLPNPTPTLQGRIALSPSPPPVLVLPQPMRGRLVISDDEDESPPRPASRAQSSASRAQDDMEIEEVGGIPSVVADRTRGRTKAATSPKEVPSPAAAAEESELSEEEEEEDEEDEEVEEVEEVEESPKKGRSGKRKATAVDDAEAPVAPAKKAKVTAAGKGKDAKAAPVRKPAAKKGKSTAS